MTNESMKGRYLPYLGRWMIHYALNQSSDTSPSTFEGDEQLKRLDISRIGEQDKTIRSRANPNPNPDLLIGIGIHRNELLNTLGRHVLPDT